MSDYRNVLRFHLLEQKEIAVNGSKNLSPKTHILFTFRFNLFTLVNV